MMFPISGVEVSPLVPLLVGFGIAALCVPAGVSGAFLLLPFQFSVLGFTGPGVTPTNLVYNVVSTPGGIATFRSAGSLDVGLIRAIASGAVPGVIAGSVVRVTVLAAPHLFKLFVGAALVLLGANLIVQALARPARSGRGTYRAGAIRAVAGAAGIIGGIYGISGGSIIAPVLAGVFGLPVKRVAPAALVATLITSIAGVASFHVLGVLGNGAGTPDWGLAVLFGIGGIAGGYVGARLGTRVPERALRVLLGAIGLVLGMTYVAAAI